MNLQRRSFIRTAVTAGIGGIVDATFSSLLAADSSPLTVDLFESPDPTLLKLVNEIYQKCVLGKINSPKGLLKRRWLVPGGVYYGQWIWDTMFVVDLLSLDSNNKELIREVFQNYWDFQQRWNKEMPVYAHDMVACMIHPDDLNWVKYPAFSQIPILAWGVERVYQRNKDIELVKQCLGPIERFHDWYWRERDVTNSGLVTLGVYRSGAVQEARYETFDFECNMDNLKLTRHPTRKAETEGEWYGDLCVPGNSAYLIMAERSLMRLAEINNDKEMAARRKARIDKAVEAMRQHMWDEEAGLFLTVNRDTFVKVPVGTIGGWIPLIAEVPTAAMAHRMAETLQSPRWKTPLPVSTVDRTDSRWKSDGMWRGDVWPATNYQIASGLAAYGYKDLSATIADKTVTNALNNGISERYDAVTGKALGVPYLGMTCSVITLLLDGLCKQHQLSIKKT